MRRQQQPGGEVLVERVLPHQLSLCVVGAPQGLVDADPNRFYLPSYLGSRGWIALRLDRDAVDWTEVADLVTESYVQIAPKRLAAQVLG